MNYDVGVDDLIVVLGILLLGMATALGFGWVATLAYAGTICLVVGLLLARRKL